MMSRWTIGVAVAVKARMVGDSAPPDGLAAAQAVQYEALVLAVERGDVDAAGRVMQKLVATG